MNPLVSPPIKLLCEGIDAILNYCAARAKLVVGLTKRLASIGELSLPCSSSEITGCVYIL